MRAFLLCILGYALATDWERWDEETEREITDVADKRRSALNIQCGVPEGYIPCLAYRYSGNNANTAGCLDIQWPNCEWRGRSITCANGYFAQAPNIATVIISPTAYFAGCRDIDECTVYGYSGQRDGLAGCSQINGINTRTITCAAGFYPVGAPETASTIILVGNARFNGCRRILYCTTLGYSGNAEHTVSCVDGLSTRTITCQAGYFAIPPSNPVITLTGPSTFNGCTEINMCQTFGVGNSANGATCASPLPNRRTVTCVAGYAVTGTNTIPPTTSMTLTGAAAFPGCTMLNLCTLYGSSNNTLHVTGCTPGPGTNQRTIRCDANFFAAGSTNDTQITLTGNSVFGGCLEANPCTRFGYSDQNLFTLSCVPSGSSRTVTCLPGYRAKGGATALSNSVVLASGQPFLGCELIDNCQQYGYSDKNADTVACVNGVNQRTIFCDKGFYAVPPSTRTITLQGNARFLGCIMINNCNVYGYSNQSTTNVDSCVNGEHQRTITCKVGFYPLGGPLASSSIILTGSSAFQGCAARDECVVEGYSGHSDYTQNCTDGPNSRTILCNPGYYAVSPDIGTITLVGSANFAGCQLIKTCEVYGTNKKPQNVESCVQRDVNNRTITCNDGYAIDGYGETPMMVFVGKAVFPGCVFVEMCKFYGFSNRSANTGRCINGVNNRTITCKPGYHVKKYEHDHVPTPIPAPYWDNITIVGYDAFWGCEAHCGDGVVTPGEACDDRNQVDGDGCTSCQIDDGYVCPTAGWACCEAGEVIERIQQGANIECVDGFWMGAETQRREEKNFTVVIDSQVDLVISGKNHVKFCGPFFVSNTRIVIMDDGILTVAGPIGLNASAVLSITTDTQTPRVNVLGPCAQWKKEQPFVDDIRTSGLIVAHGGTVEVVQNSPIPVNSNPDLSQTNLTPLISIYGCVRYSGTFNYDAESLPPYTGNNYAPFANSTSGWANCTFFVDPEAVEFTLPSCPIVLIEHDGGSFVRLTTATRRMCAGAIAGLVIGATAAVACLAIASAVLLGGSSGGSELHYVTV